LAPNDYALEDLDSRTSSFNNAHVNRINAY
jgi:hypothetical protein